MLLSFGLLLVPFQRAKVPNCLLKDEAVQRYCCGHYVNGCAARGRGCVDCPSKRSTMQRIQLCHAAAPACIAQLQCYAKAVAPSNTSKEYMCCCIHHCKLCLCASVPYTCLPAVMFYAMQHKLSLLIAVFYLVQYTLSRGAACPLNDTQIFRFHYFLQFYGI